MTQADACIATTPEAAEIYQRVRSKHDPATVAFIPTPYPIEDQRWDFSMPRNEQSGIFVGTREWDVPSRNHFAALLVARQLCEATGEPVTVVNLDGYKGRRLLGELNFPEGKLRLIEKWKTYPDYLRDVARHKIVLQLDRSHVPGQVAGDALLCRIPCVGGDGAIERIAFPKTCGEGRTINEIASMALDLLKNPDLRAAVVAESQERARERLSFEAVRSQLANFFATALGSNGCPELFRDTPPNADASKISQPPDHSSRDCVTIRPAIAAQGLADLLSDFSATERDVSSANTAATCDFPH